MGCEPHRKISRGKAKNNFDDKIAVFAQNDDQYLRSQHNIQWQAINQEVSI